MIKKLHQQFVEPGFNYATLAAATQGFSGRCYLFYARFCPNQYVTGSDLEQLCRTAAHEALRKTTQSDSNVCVIYNRKDVINSPY